MTLQTAENNQADGVKIEDQKQLVKNHISDPLVRGERWYLVDVRWFNQWKQYVGYDNSISSSERPGPIDNSDFLAETGRVLDKASENRDFKAVPQQVWDLFAAEYGLANDQKPISCPVIETGVFTKERRLEIHPLHLKVSHGKDPKDAMDWYGSSATTLDELREEIRQLYKIDASADVKIVGTITHSVYYDFHEESEPISAKNIVPGQFIVICEREDNGKWVNPEKYNGSSNQWNSADSSEGLFSSTKLKAGKSSLASNGFPLLPSNSDSSSWSTRNSYLSKPSKGCCGLSNLGNTCFMSSAIQCLSNVPQLKNFFVEGKWENDLNKNNPLGMKGEIAKEYAKLMDIIWDGKTTHTAPRDFKYAVGNFAPRFSGYQQQDSQELMAFLLDGIHEDLNKIKDKPYVEIKAANGREDKVVAKEAWEDYKKRNDSIIIDLFHGLLKSRLTCPCGNVSVTFDPFCYLSLPLPSQAEKTMDVTFISSYGQKRPLKCKIRVPKYCKAENVIDAVSKLTHVSDDKLVAAEMNTYHKRLYKVHQYKEQSLSVHNPILVFEVDSSPENVCIGVYMRYASGSSIKNIFGYPLLVSVPKTISYADLQQRLDELCGRIVCKKPDVQQTDSGYNEMEVNQSDEEAMDTCGSPKNSSKDLSASSSAFPFTLKLVNLQGSDAQHTLQTDGLNELKDNCCIAMEFHPEVSGCVIDEKEADSYDKHPSYDEASDFKKSAVQLTDCLELFTSEERLGERDTWYCPKCKDHTRAMKKFDLWNLPKYLVIQLKRFQYNFSWRDKLDTFVNYPIEGLDLSNWVISGEEKCVYDLIAVNNHFGGLGGGHYTAWARNHLQDKWFYFDDTSVTEETSLDHIVSKSGYVLVYQQRDS